MQRVCKGDCVCAALEILRGHKGDTPNVTLKPIDSADEQGARLGPSLPRSSAAASSEIPSKHITICPRSAIDAWPY